MTAVEVVDIVASSGDLAYLGRRGKEPFGLRWIDPTSGLDRKLASVAGNGTRALGGADRGIDQAPSSQFQPTEPVRLRGQPLGGVTSGSTPVSRSLKLTRPDAFPAASRSRWM